MPKKTLTLASRKSPMAMWQAEHIKQQLLQQRPDIEVNILGVSTSGDRDKQTPLKDMGGKDVFVKELQAQRLKQQADFAVHCIKDMSVHAVSGLTLAAVYTRDDPRDALVSNNYANLDDMPAGSCIGTGSPRRESLLLAARPDLTIKPIRGNVGTRLKKLDSGEYDAILLSGAGLTRMELAHRVRHLFNPELFIPAIGQGALGLECRSSDDETLEILNVLNHVPSQLCIAAERAMNQRLGGDCHTPIGAYATLDENQDITLRGMVGSLDGQTQLRTCQKGNAENAQLIGIRAADHLITQGARDML